MEPKYDCSICGKTKPRSAFYERKNRARPVTSWCRNCRALVRKLRRGYQRCIICAKLKKLVFDGMCRSCSGWALCKKCNEIKLIGIDIYAKRTICKACLTLPKEVLNY